MQYIGVLSKNQDKIFILSIILRIIYGVVHM